MVKRPHVVFLNVLKSCYQDLTYTMAEQKFSENIWDSFLERIVLVIEQVQVSDGVENGSEKFDGELYKNKLGTVLKALGHEATKLSLVFSKPPFPSDAECVSLLTSVERTAVALLSVYCKLPKSSGLTIRKAIKATVTESLEGIKTLTETIKSGGAGSPDQLRTTGLVWEETDKRLTLPKDNCEAACCVIDKNVRLIDDAHSELTEALNCDEDDEDDLNDFLGISNEEKDYSWSESDRTLISFCLGLVKCSKNITKKSKMAIGRTGNCDGDEAVGQIDKVVDFVDRLSPIVDEMATCVYPPLRKSVVEQRASDLKQMNKDLLDFLRMCHFTTEDDMKWLEFLQKANTHNFEKIHSYIFNT